MEESASVTVSMIRTELASILAMSPQGLDPDVPLVEYGLDSVRAMDLVVAMEQRFSVEIDDDEIADLKSINDVLHCVQSKLST